jgi:hypothetical protein
MPVRRRLIAWPEWPVEASIEDRRLKSILSDRPVRPLAITGAHGRVTMSVMAVDREIVVPGERRERRPEAVFDLSEGQVAAIADALSYYERTRFATEALDAEHVLALRTVGALVDRIRPSRPRAATANCG